MSPDRAATAARILAFYLPQFHPIPENDRWWGPGFTEWTNVTRARPLFRGHHQPRLPAHLGFCDLRVPEVRAAQAQLARRHAIEGFCYWHYWFAGKRLLERPFDEVLASGEPDFPFCLAWANESWSRRWLGEERDVLMEQTYSPADDLAHIRWLITAFSDPRYLRVDGHPLLLVYRPAALPDPRRTTELWRQECMHHGLPDPYLVGIDAHSPGLDARTLGFDGTLVFEPQLGSLPGALRDRLSVFDYQEARRLMARLRRDFPTHPSICVGWDNTPRRGDRGIVLRDATPERFERGLRDTVASVQGSARERRLVFINAWNEWAEGNHLEPESRHGLAYLEAVRRVNAAAPP